MNQSEFINIFSKKIKETKKGTQDIIQDLFLLLSELLVDGQSVVFKNFGKFSSLKIQERKGINPKTLEKVIIPKLNRIKFIPSKALKFKINK